MVELNIRIVAANALIELEKYGTRKISTQNLGIYGIYLANEYENITGENTVYCFDLEKLILLCLSYSHLFKIETIDNKMFFCLKENVDLEEVKKYFRHTLSYDMLQTIKRINIKDILEQD